MDETTLKISIAAFIHDIGKFAGRELLGLSSNVIDQKAADFLPVYNGRYSHHHALYTAEFIDRFKASLPGEFDRPWGEGDGLVKLAASHHNPSTAMEWIIAEADRLSSGMDRETFDAGENDAIAISDYEKTRLLPVLEILNAGDQNEAIKKKEQYKHALPLAPLGPQTMFPMPSEKVVPSDKAAAKGEYKRLFDAFTQELDNLLHKNCIGLWFEHFESLTMQYLSQMPAARVGHVIADVSLYDHMKTTAALATALYLYHKGTESMTVSAVKDGQTEKFLLVSGDFHGIQKFIFSGYGDTRKYRSKLIRGRSFYVSVLTELAATLLCKKIGLPSVCVVLNAGGKFTLIAPNTPAAQESVRETQKEIDEWFYRLTYGEACISLSAVEASPDAFGSGEFPLLQDQINRQMVERKLCRIDLDRFGGTIESYFNHQEDRPCPFCGKRPADQTVTLADDTHSCRLCKDHIQLGQSIVKFNTMAVTEKMKQPGTNDLQETIFDTFQLCFPDSDMASEASSGRLLKYWRLNTDNNTAHTGGATLRYYNGYVPTYIDVQEPSLEEAITVGAPKTLNDIAARAILTGTDGKTSGVEALGVLKADGDQLGLLMACGLPKKLYSISRLATMSRQVNNFFVIYLPWLLQTDERFQNVYTVFAGGDDLLLIGPWNAIVALAPVVAREFNAYACKNPNIHLSAGISIHKVHTPVDAMAEEAETAIEHSKTGGRDRLTLFGETVTWREVEELDQIRKTMETWLDSKALSRSMFYRLNTFIDMAGREALLTRNQTIHIRDMDCTRWRSLLAYAVERNVGKSINPNERSQTIREIREALTQWLLTWQGKLRIPLWDIQYNRR